MKLSNFNFERNFLVIEPYKFRFMAYYDRAEIVAPEAIHPTATPPIVALYYRCNYFLNTETLA